MKTLKKSAYMAIIAIILAPLMACDGLSRLRSFFHHEESPQGLEGSTSLELQITPAVNLDIFLDGEIVVALSLVGTGVALFAMGVGKTALTKRNPARSGAEILVIGLLAAMAGYFLGAVIPTFFESAI